MTEEVDTRPRGVAFTTHANARALPYQQENVRQPWTIVQGLLEKKWTSFCYHSILPLQEVTNV